jgi:dihydrofolate synthase/folylpolyglutamate synthase
MIELPGIAYLRTFPDFEQGNVSASEALGLERVLTLLDDLGSPNLRVPVIHIAGTKGKGSTAASIAAIARAAGYRTGLFTQPHLVRLNERFQIDGAEIGDDALSAIMLDLIRPAIHRLARRGVEGVQQFEAQVALALLWFEAQAVDVAVLEVGLGGRLDGTNVVPRPLVTVLTSIGFDHTAILGGTLPLIAAEKAAIVKPGVPVVSSPQLPEVGAVFVEACAAEHAPLLLGGRDWRVQGISTDLAGTSFDLIVDNTRAAEWAELVAETEVSESFAARLHTPLLGAHQAVNAGTAAMTALIAARSLPKIDGAAIRRGLAATRWPGRFQIYANDPTVVLDGAHTPESAEAVARAVRDLFPCGRVTVVCGIQADKDIPNVVKPLASLASNVIATRSHHRRAAAPAAIASSFRAAGSTYVEERDDPLEALSHARNLAGAGDVVLVAGSLYLVGDVLAGSASIGLARK